MSYQPMIETTIRKLKIFMACWATVAVIAIVIDSLLVFFGMAKWIGMFMYLYLSVGAIIIFILMWPFYSKRLK